MEPKRASISGEMEGALREAGILVGEAPIAADTFAVVTVPDLATNTTNTVATNTMNENVSAILEAIDR